MCNMSHIATSPATVDQDKRLTLPPAIRTKLTEQDRFIVFENGDEIILKKIRQTPTLDELVPEDAEPIYDDELNVLIQEVREQK